MPQISSCKQCPVLQQVAAAGRNSDVVSIQCRSSLGIVKENARIWAINAISVSSGLAAALLIFQKAAIGIPEEDEFVALIPARVQRVQTGL